MNILHINAINEVRSTGRMCKELASVHASKGHDVRIAHSVGPVSERSFVIGRPWETKRHALHARVTGRQGYSSKRSTSDLIAFMDRFRPDVVHLHNLHANYLHLRTLFDYLANRDIATVVTLHDCWAFTGKCTHYTAVGCDRWKDGCGQCPLLKEDIPSWFFDRTEDMLIDKRKWFGAIPRLAVIGVSDWITLEAHFSILQHAAIIRRIYNWVDLKTFIPKDATALRGRLGLTGQSILLGVASHWTEAKGLTAFIQLAKARPSDQIVLVGHMPTQQTLPPNIVHIEETHDPQELATYYAAADVLLNLSEEESFGNVTAEALACGTPVLVLDSTASPELVTERTGVVVATRSIADLTDGLERLRHASISRIVCANEARQRFNLHERAEDYLHVYEELQTEKVRNVL
ncbi:glycosyltransferase [Exiguobacterium qingdaonense]|uniref:glycosyltransferase n=1 Tax=Exiguobacterium qingdaonense TaxID=2751251 RepID=UPI001BE81346|nr:glycosyltransferase [Exiguobacterium qingdaonense]